MIDLESLGITNEEIIDRVVDKLVDNFSGHYTHYEDEDGSHAHPLAKEFDRIVQLRIKEAVDAKADDVFVPTVEAFIENVVLQATNEWGEPKGDPLTFTELLVKKAEEYLLEKVNYDGKTKAQAGGYSWKGDQTRIANMIDRHLHFSIETAMKEALKDVNSNIAEGLEKTVKIKLEEWSKKIKLVVKDKP